MVLVSNTIQYNTIQYSTVQYSTVQYSTVQYSTVQYSTVQYSTVQYSTVQYSTVQYSAAQHSTAHNRMQGIIFIISWLQNRVYFLSFSTPEQGGKFKTPVAHTRLIKVESPPGAICIIRLFCIIMLR